MEQTELHYELLLRYLDGNLSPVEEAEVNDLLGRDPEARAFLRQVAEQAVTIADMQRTEDNHNLALEMEVLPDQRTVLAKISVLGTDLIMFGGDGLGSSPLQH